MSIKKLILANGKVLVTGGATVNGDSADLYDPVANTWTPTTMVGAPPARSNHTAVWDGARMIVWGGSGPCCNNWYNDGYAYTP